MPKASKIVLGLLVMAAGVIFGLNALEITHINIFFDGWWTLFMIVPCLIGLFRQQEKLGNLIGILIGVFLLLWCWDIVDFSLIWKLLFPVAIVAIGVKIIFSAMGTDQSRKVFQKLIDSGKTPRYGCGIFSGCDMNFAGQTFEGAELTAVFGGVECDLRDAMLETDCAIKVCAVFGGIDIFVPDNVQVRVSTTSLFGGVTNKAKGKKDAPVTLYISGICLFGGADIQ